MMTHPKEMITWIDVDDELPDEGVSVLVFVPGASEPVWPGYIDDGEWYWASGSRAVQETVIAWAEMPFGPKANQVSELEASR